MGETMLAIGIIAVVLWGIVYLVYVAVLAFQYGAYLSFAGVLILLFLITAVIIAAIEGV